MYIPEYIANFKKTIGTKEFSALTEEIFSGEIREIYDLTVSEYTSKLNIRDSCLLMKIAHFLKYYNEPLLTEKKQDQLSMFALVSILSCIDTIIGTNSQSRAREARSLFTCFFKNYISDSEKSTLINNIKIYKGSEVKILRKSKLAEFLLNERNNFIHRTQLLYFAIPGTTGTISRRYLRGRLAGMKSIDLSTQSLVAILKKAIIRYLYSRRKDPRQDFRQ